MSGTEKLGLKAGLGGEVMGFEVGTDEILAEH